jgi:hypothetical protein
MFITRSLIVSLALSLQVMKTTIVLFIYFCKDIFSSISYFIFTLPENSYTLTWVHYYNETNILIQNLQPNVQWHLGPVQ